MVHSDAKRKFLLTLGKFATEKSCLIADEAQAQTKYVKIRYKSPRVLQLMSTPVQKAPIKSVVLLCAVFSK